jgi:hypothetical protein
MARRMERRGVSMPSMGRMRTAGALEREMSRAASAAPQEGPPPGAASAPGAAVRGASSETLRARIGALEGEAPVTGEERALPAVAPEAGEQALPAMVPEAGEQALPAMVPDEEPPPIPADDEEPPPIPVDEPPTREQQHSIELPLPVASPGPTARPGRSPASAGPAAPSRRGRPLVAGPGGLSEAQLQSLHRRLIKAKQICGEGDAGSVKIESLKKTIQRQLPKLRQQHQGREIEFQVVVRDGRAILKAKPR